MSKHLGKAGDARARARKNPFSGAATTARKKRKVGKVLGEFKRGKLRSSSGGKVTSRKQAIAIALSEARRKRR